MKCQKREVNRSDGSKNKWGKGDKGIWKQRRETEKWKDRTDKRGREINGRKKGAGNKQQEREERMKEENGKKKDVWDQIHSCFGRAGTRQYEEVRRCLAWKIVFSLIYRLRVSLEVTCVRYDARGKGPLAIPIMVYAQTRFDGCLCEKSPVNEPRNELRDLLK
jgi:hypothetical protein